MLYKRLEKKISFKKDDSDGKVSVVVPEALFKRILGAALRSGHFDESWYLSSYPDVAKAIASGKLKSGRQHYINTGYFEGRLPFDVKVDDAYYIENNPDVASALGAKKLKDAQHHFRKYGAKEGRDPSRGFSYFDDGKALTLSFPQTSRLGAKAVGF